MIRAFYGLLGAGMLLAGAAHAQTYQVGQYLGNLNEAQRLLYYAAGSDAQSAYHAKYTPGAAYLGTANGVRMTGTASATLGGRAVALTAVSRFPTAAVFNGARAIAAMNPTVAAVTLLGAFAMDHWLEQSKLEWNTQPSTQLAKPFARWEDKRTGYWTNRYGRGNFLDPAAACFDESGLESASVFQPIISADGMSATCHAPSLGGSLGTVFFNGQLAKELVPYTWEQAQPYMADPAKDYAAVDWKGITEQLLRAGGSIAPSQITTTVTGPASQPGEKTTTTGKNAAGEPTTTTTQTTHNYTYNNNNVTHNTTTTTTTVNNITNEVENETTEETENKPDDTATDTPLPEVPQLYERKYPDGIKGVWDTKSAAIMQSPLFSLASGMVPTIGDGGCPQWSLPVDIGIIDFGVYDISLPCNVWAFVRIVILITTLFLVRRLIFGG